MEKSQSHGYEDAKGGKEFENKFAIMLSDNSIAFRREVSLDDVGRIDFEIESIYGVELTLDNNIANIQRLCYRSKRINEDIGFSIIITPFENISKASISQIFKGFDYAFDSDLQNAIDFFKKSEEFENLYNEDIAEKMLNDFYVEYLKSLREKYPTITETINSKIQIFMDESQNTPSLPNNLLETTNKEIEKSHSENNSEYLRLVLTDIFHKTDLVDKAQKLIEIIKDKGFIEAKGSLYENLGISFSQYYDTILKKLKNSGVIRKEGRNYVLDSKYSLDKIKKASYWIQYSNITKNQPKELARIILSLFGLDIEIH